MPLLSIIIANYNYGRFLEAAIQSVLSQGVNNEIELIICDAASTDNSIQVIKKFEKDIAWWCSEVDGGQSCAFNKGFSHAKGKYLTWLNADDIFMPGALKVVLHELKTYPECEWFTGNFFRVGTEGKVLGIGWGPHYYPNWLQRQGSPLVIFGPTTFFAKSIWERLGKLDERMHMMMDTDLWRRFVVAGVKQRRINRLIWVFRMHEASKTAEYGGHFLNEKARIQFAKEEQWSFEKTQYCESRLLRAICLLFRIIDGSLLVRLWLQLTLRNFIAMGGER